MGSYRVRQWNKHRAGLPGTMYFPHHHKQKEDVNALRGPGSPKKTAIKWGASGRSPSSSDEALLGQLI